MENELEELKIDNTDSCYICGSPEKRYGNSLHCWDIEYTCGCTIIGAISDDGIYLHKPCPNAK